MTARCFALVLLLGAVGSRAGAQTAGELSGRVRESWGRGLGIGGARVEVPGTSRWAVTDYKGRYRIPGLESGTYAVRVTAAGYLVAQQDTVPVYAATETGQDFFLPRDSAQQAPRVPAPVVDPHERSTRLRLDARDLEALPVVTVGEAATLWGGVAGDSYRGGRPGSQVVLVDGTPLRNAYDASSAPLGLRLPLGFLQEASVSFDPWSGGGAPALSGVTTLVTREGGSDHWAGGLRYDTDRPLSGSADLGFDRVVGRVAGPMGGARFIGVIDATGRLQAEPHGAPLRAAAPAPWSLSHNSGEWIDGAAKLTIPLGATRSVRILGAHSREQRLLLDPVFKYDPDAGSARRIDATLLSAQLRRVTGPVGLTVGMSYFARTLVTGELAAPTDPLFGALGGTFEFLGEDLARNQDTVAARAAVPGYQPSTYSDQTPWGVPAFFLSGGSRGLLVWNEYRELRLDVGLVSARSQAGSLRADASVALGRARAFQRALASVPVGGSVPTATAASADPVAVGLGAHVETPLRGGLFAGGIRFDAVSPGDGGLRVAINPHVGVQIPIGGATLSAMVARASQFPDLQFLGNVAFDDSLSGGRYRRGDADLGYESVFLQTIGLGARPWHDGLLRVTAYRRKFSGLVSSTTTSPADSGRFSSGAEATVLGLEILAEQVLGGGGRLTATVSAASVESDAPNGFFQPGTHRDVVHSAILSARTPLPGRVQAGFVVQVRSGAPFTGIAVDRLPSSFTVDVLLRRSLPVGRGASLYLDVRNALNVRHGATVPDAATVDGLAQAAYAAAPGPIPYDSPRYRAAGDLDSNGLVEGPGELLPLYRAAAQDFAVPIASYGAPRTVRVGIAIGL